MAPRTNCLPAMSDLPPSTHVACICHASRLWCLSTYSTAPACLIAPADFFSRAAPPQCQVPSRHLPAAYDVIAAGQPTRAHHGPGAGCALAAGNHLLPTGQGGGPEASRGRTKLQAHNGSRADVAHIQISNHDVQAAVQKFYDTDIGNLRSLLRDSKTTWDDSAFNAGRYGDHDAAPPSMCATRFPRADTRGTLVDGTP